MNAAHEDTLAKVPEVTLLFWVIKIAVTTLGETGGDAVSMSMNLGYLVATGIFAAVFFVAVGAQIASTRFRPYVYWTAIIATTTVGTTLADFAAAKSRFTPFDCQHDIEHACHGQRAGDDAARLLGDAERAGVNERCHQDHQHR